MIAPWVIENFPAHRCYVEPFGGAASVLLRKPRSYAEVYNDLDDGAVNLFRILRDPSKAARLCEMLTLTPFARAEFELSYSPCSDALESARRLLVRSFMGFGSDGHYIAIRTGFRADSRKSGTTPAHDWAAFPKAIPAIVRRLSGIVIESRPALQVIERHDGADTLFYLDPPYMPETRSKKSRRGKLRYHAYAHEMMARDHEMLLERIMEVRGMVVLSGYPTDIYDRALKVGRRGGWTSLARNFNADGARKRTERLWLNPALVASLAKKSRMAGVRAP